MAFRKIVAVALASLALASAGLTTSASAAPTAQRLTVDQDTATVKPVQPALRPSSGLSATTVYDVGCWTTFRPPAPHGAPMYHYYANCLSQWVVVCPAVDVNGVRTVYYDKYAVLGPYTGVADDTDTAVWYYAATIPNGLYTTVYC
jgi:hypothetical protein